MSHGAKDGDISDGKKIVISFRIIVVNRKRNLND